MKKPSAAIDARAARLRFERAAAGYPAASRLEAEVGSRMLERLDYVKVAPQRVLDAGSGPAPQARALAAKWTPAPQLIALDFSLEMLRAAVGKKRFWQKPLVRPVCADFTRLPLASGSVQLVWSNMALHWASEPLDALREFGRVLAPGGLLMLSTLGPDTLKELRAAAGASRVHEFLDMHDLGDLVVAAGFSAPVMDMEMLTLTYAQPAQLLTDLRASGQTGARAGRARGLSGKGFGQRLRAGLQAPAGGRFGASFEVVYGHAWKDAPRKLEDGRDIVQFRAHSLR